MNQEESHRSVAQDGVSVCVCVSMEEMGRTPTTVSTHQLTLSHSVVSLRLYPVRVFISC